MFVVWVEVGLLGVSWCGVRLLLGLGEGDGALVLRVFGGLYVSDRRIVSPHNGLDRDCGSRSFTSRTFNS